MPLLRNLVFSALEVCIFALPLTLTAAGVFGSSNTFGDTAYSVLFHPFYIGLIGMMIWVMFYGAIDTTRMRIGLGSVIAVLVLIWLYGHGDVIAALENRTPNKAAMASLIPLRVD